MPYAPSSAPRAAGAALFAVFAGGCALLTPRSPDAPAGEMVLVPGGYDVADTLRIPLPRAARRPPLPRRVLPHARNKGFRVEATAAEDTGAVLVLLREGPWGPGPAVDVTFLPAGRPSGDSAEEASARAEGARPCTSYTGFFLPGLGRVPSRPMIGHVQSGEWRARVPVDPRRHTLRLAPVLRLRPDTIIPTPPDSSRMLEAVYRSPEATRLIAVTRDTTGRVLVRTFAAGERFAIRTGPHVVDWTFYLLDDRPRHHSPCRGTRPPPPPPPPPVDWTAEYIASGIDSVLAAYGVPPLRSARLRPGEREIRLTAGGGMFYQPEYVLRIVERRGRVDGELYEWWSRLPGKAYAGGPLNGEKRPELAGCLDPRIRENRWVCRIDRMIPVDWRRVLARLDSLQLDRLPPQASRQNVTDQGHVLIETARPRAYNGVYYYGPQARSDSAEARAAAAAGVLGGVLAGRMTIPPDSLLKVRPIAPGGLSIPSGVILLVRDERTWVDLWRRFPSPARSTAGGSRPPRIDFSRDALLLVGVGGPREGCAWPANFIRRVEVRGDTVLAVIGDRASKHWPPPCDPGPAPVQVVAFRAPPGRPVVLVHPTGRYWQPQSPPRPVER